MVKLKEVIKYVDDLKIFFEEDRERTRKFDKIPTKAEHSSKVKNKIIRNIARRNCGYNFEITIMLFRLSNGYHVPKHKHMRLLCLSNHQRNRGIDPKIKWVYSSEAQFIINDYYRYKDNPLLRYLQRITISIMHCLAVDEFFNPGESNYIKSRTYNGIFKTILSYIPTWFIKQKSLPGWLLRSDMSSLSSVIEVLKVFEHLNKDNRINTAVRVGVHWFVIDYMDRSYEKDLKPCLHKLLGYLYKYPRRIHKLKEISKNRQYIANFRYSELVKHFANTIIDGYLFYEDCILNTMKIHSKLSVSDMLIRAIHNHRSQVLHRYDAIEERELPNSELVPESLKEFHIKTNHELLNAGIECKHCIGSYVKSTEYVFYRKNNICALVTTDGRVLQCYDIQNTITSKSQSFQNYVNNEYGKYFQENEPKKVVYPWS